MPGSKHFDLADQQHSEELLEILEEAEFKGRISILYTRRPDAMKSIQREGQRVMVYRCIGEDDTAGFGACAVNPMFLDGKVQQIGYLFGFRVKKNHMHFIRHLPEGYRFHFDENKNAAGFITTILEENIPARRLLEKKRKSMPLYDYLGQIRTFSMRTGQKARLPEGWSINRLERDEIDEMLKFYLEQGQSFQYFPVFSREDLMQGEKIPAWDSFYILRSPEGKIAAAGAVWDQQSYKQYIIQGYSPGFTFIRPVLNLLAPLLGIPSLPKPGSVLNFFILAFFLSRDMDPLAYGMFLDQMLASQTSYDSCSIGLHESNSLSAVIQKKRPLIYKSRLYRVIQQPAQAPDFQGIPFIEIGRL
jgi:hypothetical protein